MKTDSINDSNKYYHLIEFIWKEKPEISFCRYIQGENGLFEELANVEVRDINNPLFYVPLLKSEQAILSYFTDTILKSTCTDSEEIESEWIQLGSTTSPYFAIKINRRKYYIDWIYNIYQEQDPIDMKDPQETDNYFRNNSPENDDRYISNEMENKIIHLKRIHKSDEYKKRIQAIGELND